MTIQLDLPDDLRPSILQLQGDLKAQKNVGIYSQEKTIIYMLRRYKELSEENVSLRKQLEELQKSG